MKTEQMVKALSDVGACFAVTSAKYVAVRDGREAKPSYHIHPDASDPQEKRIVRIFSQEQFIDWIRTTKAAARVSQEEAFPLWVAYQDRWAK